MEPDSQSKRPAEVADVTLRRVESALAKCTELMERHLAAGEKTVPARALYFILREAGYGTGPTQKHEVNQAPQQRQQPTNQLHHNYGMRR